MLQRPWSPRQLLAPGLFMGCLLGPWSWGGPGCLITAEPGWAVAIHDGIGAWGSLGTNLWADPPPRVATALGYRLAAAGWLLVAAWCAASALPGSRPRGMARTGGAFAAGVVGAQLLLHDLDFSLAGLGLAAGCWTLGGAAWAAWGLRGDPRLARVVAIALACLGLARGLHQDGWRLFGGSLAALVLGGVVLQAVRSTPVAAASEPVLPTT